jgi:hypothetical protein
VIESFTWSDFVPIRSWISRASLPRFGARGRWSDFVQSERLDEEEQGKETTTRRNKRKPQHQKKENADQKENPVVGGYFMVLITAGSIQRVFNRLFCV